MGATTMIRSLLPLAFLLGAACSVGPEPVHLGSDACAECRMVVSEAQYAAQAVTRTGMAHKFDSIECLAAFLRGPNAPAEADLHSLWVADFAEPETWVRAEDAAFVVSPEVRSPMGAGFAGHGDADRARAHAAEVDGEVVGWPELLSRAAAGGHAHVH
jgi:copper chaperone NosL